VNLRELSKNMNMPYSTVRKYINVLIEHELINPERNNRTLILNTDHVNIFKTLVSLIQSGYSFNTAIQKLKEGFSNPNNEVIQYIQRLEKRIENLEKENRNLNQLIQIYLSKIDNIEDQIKALPKPKESIWKKIKRLFKP